ncbi:ABC transporter permease [Mesorhizobium sp. M1E.F.Ca.ET.041.01.1.1]|uniref:ABC transporter permease n=1 Tax=Mesorhizobium sp. M1E.F.Ca.ET.041.01.1.1 TaxID=2496759 RepID=UPI000FCC02CD|nr:ABC transporter permease [Mesorhizobium sp. M1E.F.Ca.ET.041.01.1.1]RUW36310.1 ABC transporter permease [Mesorhizobium sp. M1E.F.Ca.ET.041.01.1.1]
MRRSSPVLLVAVGAVYIFLLVPTVIVLLSSINPAAYLSFPPHGISLRWYQAFFVSTTFMDALLLSLAVGALTAVVAAAIATPAALFYVRHLNFAREQFRLAMLAPMLLPEVLTAIALLLFFNHYFGGTRDLLPLLIGHVVVTLPMVFLSVTSALYNMPPAVEEAARTLGANPFRTFILVTLPLIKSGIVTGAMLAFILSFDNVNISLLLKPVGSSTLPIQLYDYLRYDLNPTAAAASAVSIAITFAVVFLIDRLYGLRAVRF